MNVNLLNSNQLDSANVQRNEIHSDSTYNKSSLKFSDYIDKTSDILQNTNKLSKTSNTSKELNNPDKVNKASKTYKATKSSKADSTTKDHKLTKEQLESILVLLQETSNIIIEEVSFTLNISETELESLLEDSGFSALDLLNKENASQFYLYLIEDSNLVNIITNENLTSEYTSFMEILRTTENSLHQELLQSISHDDMDIQALVKDVLSDDIKVQGNMEGLVQKDQGEENPNLQASKLDGFSETVTSHTSDNKSINIVLNDQRDKKPQSDSLLEQSGDKSNWNGLNNNLNMGIGNNQSIVSSSNQTNEIHDVSLQIIEQIKVNLQANQTALEIDLHPEHLGKLSLELASKNGILTAKFITQNEGTKGLIESQLMILKEELNLQGLKVEDIEVEIGLSQYFQNQDSGSDSNQESHNQGRKRIVNTWQTLEEENLDDLVSEDLLISYEQDDVSSNTVNFSA